MDCLSPGTGYNYMICHYYNNIDLTAVYYLCECATCANQVTLHTNMVQAKFQCTGVEIMSGDV